MKKHIVIFLSLVTPLVLATACQGPAGTFVITPTTNIAAVVTPPATPSTSSVLTTPAISTLAPFTQTSTTPTAAVTLSVVPTSLPPPDGTISLPTRTSITTIPMTTTPVPTSASVPVITVTAPAGQVSFSAILTGDEEIPLSETPSIGRFRISFNAERTQALFELTVNGGVGITAAKLHLGSPDTNGPVVATLFSRPAGINITGTLASATLSNASLTGQLTSLEALANAMTQGDIYVNMYSLAKPDGLIRGQMGISSVPVTATMPVTIT